MRINPSSYCVIHTANIKNKNKNADTADFVLKGCFIQIMKHHFTAFINLTMTLLAQVLSYPPPAFFNLSRTMDVVGLFRELTA